MTEAEDNEDSDLAAVVAALYGIRGWFTIQELADAAGGDHLYEYAFVLVRDKLADGTVQLVNGERRPRIYKVAPDR